MESFLTHVARSLFQTFGSSLSQCCLVFPSRRARLFFNKALSQVLDKDIWQPNWLGISQLIEKMTGRATSDSLALLALLYSVYTRVTGKEVSFDGFYHLGTMMLQDFDTLDKYHVDPDQLFRNIKDLKEIEQDYSFLTPEQRDCIRSFWSAFDTHPDHSLNRSFISIWEFLPLIYKQFTELLEEKGMTYEGLNYRRACDQIHSPYTTQILGSYEHFVFIGFNALSTCEKHIFRHLQAQHKALFFWDYDPYYTEDTMQEAGLFIRDNLKEFPPFVPYDKHTSPLRDGKEWEEVPLPSYVLQAKIVPQIIQRHQIPYDIHSAIVLADEQLLMPLLYSLDKDETINVTMGFPLKGTPLYTLIDTWLRMSKSKHSYKDVLPLLHHPYIQAMGGPLAQELQDDWILHNTLQMTPDKALSFPLMSKMLETPEDVSQITLTLNHLLIQIEGHPQLMEGDRMLPAVIRHTRKQINTLFRAVTQASLQMSPSLYSQLLMSHLAQARIPFSGEPMEGLQVMGVLETRCLDFDNLIILSAQEGFLPKKAPDNSLIPNNLKAAFSLPTPKEHLSMHAYYFFRLLQRAKKVTFVYADKNEGLGKGEKSRFLRQLAQDFTIGESRLTYQLNLPAIRPIVIPKTGETRRLLQAYLCEDKKKTISPSALKAYIQCPLRFYFQYLMGLKENPDISDEIDSRHFGDLVHATLEQLYRPYLGQLLDKEQLQRMLQDKSHLKTLIDQNITKYFFKEEPTRESQNHQQWPGTWLLIADVILLYIEAFLKLDISHAPLIVHAVEMPFDCSFNGISFHGIIDRIEERMGQLYICDFKTGKQNCKLASIDGLFNHDPKNQNDSVFQVLCYAILYARNNPSENAPIPILYFLRNMFSSQNSGLIIENKNDITDIRPYQESFESNLGKLLEELFNFDLPFVQTTYQKEICSFCPFNTICQRQKYD